MYLKLYEITRYFEKIMKIYKLRADRSSIFSEIQSHLAKVDRKKFLTENLSIKLRKFTLLTETLRDKS